MAALLALWTIWALIAAFACIGVAVFSSNLGAVARCRRHPQAVVIVPVKGASAFLPQCVQALLGQNYQQFRLLFSVESIDDPAYSVLVALAAENPGRIEVVVAGLAESGGQKVWNQRAALKRLHRDDRMIVFADSDILPAADWLERLVAPLLRKSLLVTTGYRWFEPAAGTGLATALASVVNSSVATLLRPNWWWFARYYGAWGGSMALSRQTLEAIDLERWWDGALSDDLQLTAAVLAAGGRVRRIRAAMPRSPIAFGWREAVVFGRRQYLIVRTHAAPIWWFGAVVTTLPLAGWLTALPLALVGNGQAQVVIALVVALDLARAGLRRRVVRQLWGGEGLARLRWPLLLDMLATPLWLALHAAVVWSAMFGREIDWAGLRYRIDAPDRVRILSRRG